MSEKLQEPEELLVPVSPRHSVRLAAEYIAFIKRAPSRDFVVRTITTRNANGLPLMSADIVIAGEEPRALYPLAARYPLHFRKTYFPGCLHGDPQDEFDRQTEAAGIIPVPPPIGWSPMTFRACLIPGGSYSRLTPFGVDPPESNIRIARELRLPSAAGLWMLAQQALDHLLALHGAGLAHGDAELHNFIVTPSPLELLPIDFEGAMRRESVTEEAWQARCEADLVPLLREAVYLLCALGPQHGRLADLAWQRMDRLFRDPDRFCREIGRHLDLGA